MIRSTLAVLAGYVVLATFVMIATIVSARLMLNVAGVEAMRTMKPTTAYVVVNLVYSALFAVLGGFVTGGIARRAPVTHALVLGALMLILGIVYARLNSTTSEPAWYRFTLLILGPLGALLGGYLQYLRQQP